MEHLSDHGDNGTSVYDEIDQKIKVGQNTWFFLSFFSLWKNTWHDTTGYCLEGVEKFSRTY